MDGRYFPNSPPPAMISAFQTLLHSQSKGHHSTGNTLGALNKAVIPIKKEGSLTGTQN